MIKNIKELDKDFLSTLEGEPLLYLSGFNNYSFVAFKKAMSIYNDRVDLKYYNIPNKENDYVVSVDNLIFANFITVNAIKRFEVFSNKIGKMSRFCEICAVNSEGDLMKLGHLPVMRINFESEEKADNEKTEILERANNFNKYHKAIDLYLDGNGCSRIMYAVIKSTNSTSFVESFYYLKKALLKNALTICKNAESCQFLTERMQGLSSADDLIGPKDKRVLNNSSQIQH